MSGVTGSTIACLTHYNDRHKSRCGSAGGNNFQNETVDRSNILICCYCVFGVKRWVRIANGYVRQHKCIFAVDRPALGQYPTKRHIVGNAAVNIAVVFKMKLYLLLPRQI